MDAAPTVPESPSLARASPSDGADDKTGRELAAAKEEVATLKQELEHAKSEEQYVSDALTKLKLEHKATLQERDGLKATGAETQELLIEERDNAAESAKEADALQAQADTDAATIAELKAQAEEEAGTLQAQADADAATITDLKAKAEEAETLQAQSAEEIEDLKAKAAEAAAALARADSASSVAETTVAAAERRAVAAEAQAAALSGLQEAGRHALASSFAAESATLKSTADTAVARSADLAQQLEAATATDRDHEARHAADIRLSFEREQRSAREKGEATDALVRAHAGAALEAAVTEVQHRADATAQHDSDVSASMQREMRLRQELGASAAGATAQHDSDVSTSMQREKRLRQELDAASDALAEAQVSGVLRATTAAVQHRADLAAQREADAAAAAAVAATSAAERTEHEAAAEMQVEKLLESASAAAVAHARAQARLEAANAGLQSKLDASTVELTLSALVTNVEERTIDRYQTRERMHADDESRLAGRIGALARVNDALQSDLDRRTVELALSDLLQHVEARSHRDLATQSRIAAGDAELAVQTVSRSNAALTSALDRTAVELVLSDLVLGVEAREVAALEERRRSDALGFSRLAVRSNDLASANVVLQSAFDAAQVELALSSAIEGVEARAIRNLEAERKAGAEAATQLSARAQALAQANDLLQAALNRTTVDLTLSSMVTAVEERTISELQSKGVEDRFHMTAAAAREKRLGNDNDGLQETLDRSLVEASMNGMLSTIADRALAASGAALAVAGEQLLRKTTENQSLAVDLAAARDDIDRRHVEATGLELVSRLLERGVAERDVDLASGQEALRESERARAVVLGQREDLSAELQATRHDRDRSMCATALSHACGAAAERVMAAEAVETAAVLRAQSLEMANLATERAALEAAHRYSEAQGALGHAVGGVVERALGDTAAALSQCEARETSLNKKRIDLERRLALSESRAADLDSQLTRCRQRLGSLGGHAHDVEQHLESLRRDHVTTTRRLFTEVWDTKAALVATQADRAVVRDAHASERTRAADLAGRLGAVQAVIGKQRSNGGFKKRYVRQRPELSAALAAASTASDGKGDAPETMEKSADGAPTSTAQTSTSTATSPLTKEPRQAGKVPRPPKARRVRKPPPVSEASAQTSGKATYRERLAVVLAEHYAPDLLEAMGRAPESAKLSLPRLGTATPPKKPPQSRKSKNPDQAKPETAHVSELRALAAGLARRVDAMTREAAENEAKLERKLRSEAASALAASEAERANDGRKAQASAVEVRDKFSKREQMLVTISRDREESIRAQGEAKSEELMAKHDSLSQSAAAAARTAREAIEDAKERIARLEDRIAEAERRRAAVSGDTERAATKRFLDARQLYSAMSDGDDASAAGSDADPDSIIGSAAGVDPEKATAVLDGRTAALLGIVADVSSRVRRERDEIQSRLSDTSAEADALRAQLASFTEKLALQPEVKPRKRRERPKVGAPAATPEVAANSAPEEDLIAADADADEDADTTGPVAAAQGAADAPPDQVLATETVPAATVVAPAGDPVPDTTSVPAVTAEPPAPDTSDAVAGDTAPADDSSVPTASDDAFDSTAAVPAVVGDSTVPPAVEDASDAVVPNTAGPTPADGAAPEQSSPGDGPAGAAAGNDADEAAFLRDELDAALVELDALDALLRAASISAALNEEERARLVEVLGSSRAAEAEAKAAASGAQAELRSVASKQAVAVKAAVEEARLSYEGNGAAANAAARKRDKSKKQKDEALRNSNKALEAQVKALQARVDAGADQEKMASDADTAAEAAPSALAPGMPAWMEQLQTPPAWLEQAMKLQVPEQGQGQQKALVAQSSRPTSGPFASMAARAFGRRLRPKKAAGLAGMASLVLPRKQSAAKPSPPKSPRRPGGKPVKTAEAPPPDPAQVSAASAIQKAFRPRINQRILAATTLQSAARRWNAPRAAAAAVLQQAARARQSTRAVAATTLQEWARRRWPDFSPASAPVSAASAPARSAAVPLPLLAALVPVAPRRKIGIGAAALAMRSFAGRGFRSVSPRRSDAKATPTMSDEEAAAAKEKEEEAAKQAEEEAATAAKAMAEQRLVESIVPSEANKRFAKLLQANWRRRAGPRIAAATLIQRVMRARRAVRVDAATAIQRRARRRFGFEQVSAAQQAVSALTFGAGHSASVRVAEATIASRLQRLVVPKLTTFSVSPLKRMRAAAQSRAAAKAARVKAAAEAAELKKAEAEAFALMFELRFVLDGVITEVQKRDEEERRVAAAARVECDEVLAATIDKVCERHEAERQRSAAAIQRACRARSVTKTGASIAIQSLARRAFPTAIRPFYPPGDRVLEVSFKDGRLGFTAAPKKPDEGTTKKDSGKAKKADADSGVLVATNIQKGGQAAMLWVPEGAILTHVAGAELPKGLTTGDFGLRVLEEDRPLAVKFLVVDHEYNAMCAEEQRAAAAAAAAAAKSKSPRGKGLLRMFKSTTPAKSPGPGRKQGGGLGGLRLGFGGFSLSPRKGGKTFFDEKPKKETEAQGPPSASAVDNKTSADLPPGASVTVTPEQQAVVVEDVMKAQIAALQAQLQALSSPVPSPRADKTDTGAEEAKSTESKPSGAPPPPAGGVGGRPQRPGRKLSVATSDRGDVGNASSPGAVPTPPPARG